MSQFWKHEESADKLTLIVLQIDVSNGIRRETSFYTRKMLQIHVNICNTFQLLAGIIQCNSWKLEEAEDFKCVFVVYCVLESK